MKAKAHIRSRDDVVFEHINGLLLAIIVLLMLYPFYYILVNAFNEGQDAAKASVYFFPRKPTLENFEYIFKNDKWVNSIYVTLGRTVLGTLLCVLFTSMVAYGISFRDLVFRKVYYALIILSMYFSGGLIPYYVVLKSLGLLNTFWVYVIPTSLDTFFVLIAVSFYQDIPFALIESARLDGAGEFKIFTHIILPVSRPLLATMLLFVGVNQWNSWLDSAYFVKEDTLRTLAYRMIEVLNQATLPTSAITSAYQSATRVTNRSVQMAAMIVATLPIMCVYPFLQKYFVSGIMIGAVKG